ncbi:MAG: hypothetical protein LCH46_00055 [Proteobacteria bacterium]|nr:hypothetical protein [Pseudomonadota bacterium]
MAKTKRSASNFILLLSDGERKAAIAELQNVEHFTKSDIRDLASLLSDEPLDNSYSDFQLITKKRSIGRAKSALLRIEAYENGREVFIRAAQLKGKHRARVKQAIQELSTSILVAGYKKAGEKPHNPAAGTLRRDYEYFLQVEQLRRVNGPLVRLPPLPSEKAKEAGD